ncbi:MAG: hypothetical protein LBF85_10480, partial [Tannerella sp.]|nr:hypothetical protein [Tannerella sp.]
METDNKGFVPGISSVLPENRGFVFRILVALLLLAGCEKADVYTMDPQTNFDVLWRIIDEHYCFFEYKNVDWDDVYRKYSVQLSDTMSKYALFDLLGDMLGELKDGHTNLISSFNIARYWEWYENFPRNFNEDVHSNYLRGCRITGGVEYQRLAGNRIGYMYYGSFSSSISEAGLNEIFQY